MQSWNGACCTKRTTLLAATVLLTASALAQTVFEQGKPATDETAACAGFFNQGTTEPSCALAQAEINVAEKGDGFLICATSEVNTDSATIWSTLSDYDHLAGFIPGMLSSRTVSRSGAEAVVEQQGRFGIGPFYRSFTVLLAIREQLNQSISASAIGGDFRCFESRYEVVPLGPQHARIVYQATLVPRTSLPAIVGLPAMRFLIGNQFNALLEEIRRRASAA